MATTYTDRLALAKQANGDNPGAWEVDLNTGFDDADDRFFKTGTGDPNGAIDSDYIGQRYLDTNTDYWWTAGDVASPSSDWTSDFETIDADVVHPDPPTTYYNYGMLQAQLEWVGNTSVRLVPTLGPDIFIDIDVDGLGPPDGIRNILSHTGALVFDIVANHHGAAEAPSQANYLYVEDDNDNGVIDVHVAPEAPQDVGGSKPGYHVSETTWRCVGSVWNDSGSDLTKGYWDTNGKFTLDAVTRDHTDHLYNAMVKTQSASLLQQVVGIPKTCTSFEVEVFMKSTQTSGGVVALGQDNATATVPSAVGPHKLSDAGLTQCTRMLMTYGASDGGIEIVEFPIITRAAPAFRYASGRSTTLTDLEAMMISWTDLWAPRGV